MSLLIKGMDMPKAGNVIICGRIEDKLQATIVTRGESANWCKIFEIPTPHGRLIDADRLIAVLKSTTVISHSNYDLFNHIVGLIEHQPTVIEKEMNQ